MKLKPAGRIRGTERDLEIITPNLRFNFPRLNHPKLKPNAHRQPHTDPVHSRHVILLQIRPRSVPEHHQVLPLHLRRDHRRVLLLLVERRDVDGAEPLVSVVSAHLHRVVEDAETLVRVPDREIEVEIVVEVAVAVVRVEVETVQIGVGDVEFDGVGAEDQPEDQGGYGEDDGDGDEDVPDQA